MTIGQLGKRVAYWCTKLQLDPWEITLKIESDPEGNQSAKIRCMPSYLDAEIKVREEWWDQGPSAVEIDRMLVHELLHCLFRDLDNACESVTGLLGPVVQEVHEDRYEHELEQLIQRLAIVIVNLNAD